MISLRILSSLSALRKLRFQIAQLRRLIETLNRKLGSFKKGTKGRLVCLVVDQLRFFTCNWGKSSARLGFHTQIVTKPRQYYVFLQCALAGLLSMWTTKDTNTVLTGIVVSMDSQFSQ